MNKNTTIIPKGPYCYTVKEIVDNPDKSKPPIIKTNTCPYWSKRKDMLPQEDGFCSYLDLGDWDLKGGLLWDQCKECGINFDDEDEPCINSL